MYLDVPLDEKRTMYKCGNKFTTLDKVDPWTTTLSRLEDSLKLNQSDFQKITGKRLVLVKKMCLNFRITSLQFLIAHIVSTFAYIVVPSGRADI